MTKPTPKCGNCQFYQDTESRCRRYPEHITRGVSGWCGEHKPKSHVTTSAS